MDPVQKFNTRDSQCRSFDYLLLVPDPSARVAAISGFRKKLIIVLCTIIFILSGVWAFAQFGYPAAMSIWRFVPQILRVAVLAGIIFGFVKYGWRYGWQKFYPVSYFVATNDSLHLKMLGRTAVPMLMEALTTKSGASGDDDRRKIIDLLGQIDDVRATEALLELLRTEDLAGLAENALVNGGDPVVPFIVKAMQKMKHNKADALIRARAAIVLGRIGSMKSIIAARLAFADENLHVRLQAASVLLNKGVIPTAADEQSIYNGVAPLAEYLKLRTRAVDPEKYMRTPDVDAEPFTVEQTKTVIDYMLRGITFRVDYIPAKIHLEAGEGWDWSRGSHRSVPVVDVPARWDIVLMGPLQQVLPDVSQQTNQGELAEGSAAAPEKRTS